MARPKKEAVKIEDVKLSKNAKKIEKAIKRLGKIANEVAELNLYLSKLSSEI